VCGRAASDAGGSGLPSGVAEAAARADKEGGKAEERWKRMTYPAGRILHLVPARLRAPSCHPLPSLIISLCLRREAALVCDNRPAGQLVVRRIAHCRS
jgi:hypothetical protein